MLLVPMRSDLQTFTASMTVIMALNAIIYGHEGLLQMGTLVGIYHYGPTQYNQPS